MVDTIKDMKKINKEELITNSEMVELLNPNPILNPNIEKVARVLDAFLATVKKGYKKMNVDKFELTTEDLTIIEELGFLIDVKRITYTMVVSTCIKLKTDI